MIESTHTQQLTILNRIQNWFYDQEVPYSLALIRITYPLALLVALIPRWFHVRELYSTDGSPTPFWWGYGYSDILPIFSAETAICLYTVMIFLLCTVSVGWKTKPALFLLAILVPYFGVLDSLGTLTKYTVVSAHVFLLLGFSGCGSIWSIDAWLERRKVPGWKVPKFEVWPARLIQLMICFIYLGSAATKIHTQGYFSGEQMYFWALTNVNFPNPMGEWITGYPSILVISGLFAIAWEVMFIFLVWKDPTRVIMLALGILFHLMTYLLLGLLVFPLLFFSLYFCFLKEAECRRIQVLFAKLSPMKPGNSQLTLIPFRIASWPAFVFLLIVSSMAAVAAERRMDVYGEHGEDGPVVLEPLPQEVLEEVLRNDTKVEISDQLFSIDVGTHILGGYVANQRTSFSAGETIAIQARLIMPHHDLWVEYILRDAAKTVIARDGTLAARDESKSTFRIPLGGQLTTGEYEIEVKLNGFIAGSRKISINN